MAKAKQYIDSSLVLKFLQDKFDKQTVNVIPINEGETSAAFFFTVGDRQYVIRIGGNLEFFEKDRFAGDFFGSSHIPVPRIIALGEFGKDIYYAISKKIEGNLFFSFKGEKFEKLLPNFITTLDAIHNTNIEKYSGYGDWNAKGVAYFSSWKTFLESIQDNNYFNWKQVFATTPFTKDTFELLFKKHQSLLEFCPEDRNLIHGDYGVNNILAKEDKITGVLDWGLSMYGDPLYDVAWIDFWPAQAPFGEIFFKHYKAKGINVKNYWERILCYKIHFVIASMHFYATSNNKEMYEYTLNRILKQISQKK